MALDLVKLIFYLKTAPTSNLSVLPETPTNAIMRRLHASLIKKEIAEPTLTHPELIHIKCTFWNFIVKQLNIKRRYISTSPIMLICLWVDAGSWNLYRSLKKPFTHGLSWVLFSFLTFWTPRYVHGSSHSPEINYSYVNCSTKVSESITQPAIISSLRKREVHLRSLNVKIKRRKKKVFTNPRRLIHNCSKPMQARVYSPMICRFF